MRQGLRWLTGAGVGSGLVLLGLLVSGCERQTLEEAEAMGGTPRLPVQSEGTMFVAGDQWLNEPVMVKLSQPVRLQCEGTPLEQAVSQIQEQTGARIHVNWGMLRPAGVRQDFPVNAIVEDSGTSALSVVLMGVNELSREPVGFGIVDGIVVVSTESHFETMRYYRAKSGR